MYYYLKCIIKYHSILAWTEEKPLKTKRNKVNNVPVFTRGPKLNSENSIQNDFLNPFYSKNDNNITNESDNEDCDMLIVDWKNMTPIKITDISELQPYDLIQFKVSDFLFDVLFSYIYIFFIYT